jgi:hypothetical protein
MKNIGQLFDEYCTKHQTRYSTADVARAQSCEAYFSGAAAMASLFAEGGFIGFEERAKQFEKMVKEGKL